jgi:large subunit ribosomal protein L6
MSDPPDARLLGHGPVAHSEHDHRRDQGFSKKLEINGVGWNAKPQGKQLQLNVGYCHPVNMAPPRACEFVIEGNAITVSGPDKQAVGQFAAEIRSKRPPEPYNGKGIKYVDEIIIRKQGKVFGA